ncbi:hypothetical protein EDC01DRAFT_651432 [Geopyxis carbonaria]|nr:hypothetical protein EDC01DRAFT_651432 [Geopyxis carbonaria]
MAPGGNQLAIFTWLKLSCETLLSFIYDNGITHGDLQFGNILIAANGLDNFHEQELMQNMKTDILPINRLDGELNDKWVPRYISESRPLQKYMDTEPNCAVKLSDFGAIEVQERFMGPILYFKSLVQINLIVFKDF